MKILMVGDIVGKPGREAALQLIPRLRSTYRPDFVIANAENAAGGLGITREIGLSLLDEGRVDVITLGNHAWSKRDSHAFLDHEQRVVRPANYPPGVPGHGYGIYSSPAGDIGVVSLQGRVFMDPSDDPFRTADTLVQEINQTTRVVVVDFHGEATSEKQAFGWYMDGRVSAVVGTHTHVQTADERVLTRGTAYITDVGMTGPIDSVIGMKRDVVIPRFTTLMSARFEVAEGPARLCAVLIDVDSTTGRATSIVRIQVDAAWGSP